MLGIELEYLRKGYLKINSSRPTGEDAGPGIRMLKKEMHLWNMHNPLA